MRLATRSAIVTILAAMLVAVIAGKDATGQQRPTTQPREPWQDDLATFIQVFRKATTDYQKVNPGPVDFAKIAPSFVGKPIRWTATLKYLHDGRPYFLEAFVKTDVNEAAHIAEFFPPADKLAQWQKCKPGDTVTFTGRMGKPARASLNQGVLFVGVDVLDAVPEPSAATMPASRPGATRPASRPAAEPTTQAVPKDWKLIRDIPFSKADPVLTLDLYLPQAKSDKPLPLVIIVHGGGWSGRHKYPLITFGDEIMAAGFPVASITYRLSKEAVFPAQIIDCKAAVRFLRANAGRYNLDPRRFGVFGESAGGHLVALLGTSGGVKEWDVGENLEASSDVQAVCDLFGPTDLLAAQSQLEKLPHFVMNMDDKNSPMSRLIGGALQENKDNAARANPITCIAAGKKYPPFLIMHGTRDDLVPPAQSQLLYDALRAAGAAATLKWVEGLGHGGPVWKNPTQNNQKIITDFFDKELRRPAGASTMPATQTIEW